MALLLDSYSEQNFILSVLRKLDKIKFQNIVQTVPKYSIPKMGTFRKISFLMKRCCKCCSKNQTMINLFDEASEELDKSLSVINLI